MARCGWAVFLLGALLLAGCPASHRYREGLKAEERGQVVQAADFYVEALERNPDHAKARAALEGVSAAAWEKRLTKARKYESDLDFLDARGAYVSLAAFRDSLDAFGIPFPAEPDLEAKIAEMEQAAAAREYMLGEKSYGTGDYEGAIGHYRKALEIVADYKDTNERIGRAYYAWAEADVAKKAWRSAADRFESAYGAIPKGYEDADRRAAEIFGALGAYHASKLACRQAVADFRSAGRLVPGSYATDLEKAVKCATSWVALRALTPPSKPPVSGVDVAGRVTGSVLERLPGSVSEFVKLVDESAGSAPTGTPPIDLVVSGSIVTARLERPLATETERTVAGETMGECVERDAAGVEVKTTCRETMDVAYTEVEATKTALLSASLRIVKGKTREVVASETFDASVTDGVRYAHGFKRASDGSAVTLSGDPETGVVVDSVVRDLAGARTALRGDTELLNEASDALVLKIVSWTAGVVDVGPSVDDPVELTVTKLPKAP